MHSGTAKHALLRGVLQTYWAVECGTLCCYLMHTHAHARNPAPLYTRTHTHITVSDLATYQGVSIISCTDLIGSLR